MELALTTLRWRAACYTDGASQEPQVHLLLTGLHSTMTGRVSKPSHSILVRFPVTKFHIPRLASRSFIKSIADQQWFFIFSLVVLSLRARRDRACLSCLVSEGECIAVQSHLSYIWVTGRVRREKRSGTSHLKCISSQDGECWASVTLLDTSFLQNIDIQVQMKSNMKFQTAC